jgi:hypothetical protein
MCPKGVFVGGMMQEQVCMQHGMQLQTHPAVGVFASKCFSTADHQHWRRCCFCFAAASALLLLLLLLLLLQIGMKAVRGKEDAFNACAAGTLSAALLGAACEYKPQRQGLCKMR